MGFGQNSSAGVLYLGTAGLVWCQGVELESCPAEGSQRFLEALNWHTVE